MEETFCWINLNYLPTKQYLSFIFWEKILFIFLDEKYNIFLKTPGLHNPAVPCAHTLPSAVHCAMLYYMLSDIMVCAVYWHMCTYNRNHSVTRARSWQRQVPGGTRVMRTASMHLRLRFTPFLRRQRPRRRTVRHTIQYMALIRVDGVPHDMHSMKKQSWNNGMSKASLHWNSDTDAGGAKHHAGINVVHFTWFTGLNARTSAVDEKRHRQGHPRVCSWHTSTLFVRPLWCGVHSLREIYINMYYFLQYSTNWAFLKYNKYMLQQVGRRRVCRRLCDVFDYFFV